MEPKESLMGFSPKWKIFGRIWVLNLSSFRNLLANQVGFGCYHLSCILFVALFILCTRLFPFLLRKEKLCGTTLQFMHLYVPRCATFFDSTSDIRGVVLRALESY